jgi:hypothetical protein
MSDDGIPIGDLMNRLGIVFYPVEGDSVEDAIVLMRVVEEDGSEKLVMQHSAVSWFTRIGMLRQQELLESNPGGFHDCDDGDDD